VKPRETRAAENRLIMLFRQLGEARRGALVTRRDRRGTLCPRRSRRGTPCRFEPRAAPAAPGLVRCLIDQRRKVEELAPTSLGAGRRTGRSLLAGHPKRNPRSRRCLLERSVVRNHSVLSDLEQRHPPSANEARSGSRRAANARNRAYVILYNQAPEARRAASIERLRVNRRQSSSSWNKPVTPEVAGSSPVAPVTEIRANQRIVLPK